MTSSPDCLHADHCHVGEAFHSTVMENITTGFSWINEQKGSRARWGMVANEVGGYHRLYAVGCWFC